VSGIDLKKAIMNDVVFQKLKAIGKNFLESILRKKSEQRMVAAMIAKAPIRIFF
jgi:hypothetical protein